MKKSFVLLIAGLSALIPASGQTAGNVHLSGTITGFDSGEVKIRRVGMAANISDYNAITLPVDGDGRFDITLAVDKPTYFAIGRNVLYLSPGDRVEASIARRETESRYDGRGAAANNYLTRMYYPQNGSFLETGRNVRSDFASTRAVADSIYRVRLAELEALEDVGEHFKRMERARLKGDIMSSYMAYASYSRNFFDGCRNEEEAMARYTDFAATLAPEFTPLLEELASDDDYLEIPVVLDQIGTALQMEGLYRLPVSDRLKEYIAVEERSAIFDEGLTPEIYDEAARFAGGLANRDLAEAFMFRLDKQSKLMEGRPAIDLELISPDGTASRLSDHKGKVLYVDFWATWCGPCMGEMPYYAELSAKYPDIVFVSISTDGDRKAWKSKLERDHHPAVHEYLSHDPQVNSGWDVTGIPRYLLIDSDFNIISSNAPRPSQKDVIEPLLEKLSRK